MLGEHSKREYRLIMVGVCALLTIVVLGDIFPIIETAMTILIVSCVIAGIVTWAIVRIGEAREMYYVLHAPVEELIKDDYSE